MKALIKGASSGIGRDIAKELAKKGYDLVLVAKNEERLNKVKEKILKDINEKINIKVCPIDLDTVENCEKIYNETKNDDIDILINNAGLGGIGNFEDVPMERDLEMIHVNIRCMHILAKLYLKDMKNKNKGIILNVASIAGLMPAGPKMATYYASKAYVVSLTRAIKEELRREKSKVQISLLCPGPVDTNFNNIAGCKFNLKSVSSEYVAKYTVNKMLRGKFIIIPSFTIKCVKVLSKIMPSNIVTKIAYKQQVKKEKNKK